MSRYVLGTGEAELARLGLQQEVWGGVTERFLDRLRVRPGMRVLDAGCGPGYVLESLRSRVGSAGHVTALDESPAWLTHVAARVADKGWRNVHLVQSRVEEAALEESSYDLVFMRWVLSFLPDAGAVLARLARALRPGGLLAVQDYNHEGVSLFPESEGFRAVIRATRALYASRGGDTWVAGRLYAHAGAAGLEVVDYTPTVLSGPPGSPAFRWADAFFTHHCRGMVDAGVLSADEKELFLREWTERKASRDAVFFSPIVVDCAMRR